MVRRSALVEHQIVEGLSCFLILFKVHISTPAPELLDNAINSSSAPEPGELQTDDPLPTDGTQQAYSPIFLAEEGGIRTYMLADASRLRVYEGKKVRISGALESPHVIVVRTIDEVD